ncbi:MAG: adenosine-specific kinase [Candidatus Omnitrophota bacterium]
MSVELEVVKIQKPEDVNIIIGQAHFIKTVEDLYEVIAGGVPFVSFAVAFCEASGKCLVRVEGNDDDLKESVIKAALSVGAGHSFFIMLKGAYPINFLPQIKNVPEVCRIFCATANPVDIIVAVTENKRGIIGVIDGSSPEGVEGPQDIQWRKDFLRKIGYKR